MVPALNRVLLTGATGLVGRHVLARLRREGIACLASSRAVPSGTGPDVQWRAWDLCHWRSPDDLDRLFPEVEAVLHVGALVPAGPDTAADRLMDANVRATLALGQWAAARRLPLLFLSGAAVYGDVTAPARESDPVAALPVGGLYGLTKALAEGVLIQLAAASGLRLAVLRASSIYGWGLGPAKLVSALLAKAQAGEAIELHPPADDRVNLVHAADVAWAMVAAATRGATGIFNIGGPAQVSMLELAQACVQAAGAGSVTVSEQEAGRGPHNRFPLDLSKAQSQLGYGPGIDLVTGLTMQMRSDPLGRMGAA